jgi:hypothetical protein
MQRKERGMESVLPVFETDKIKDENSILELQRNRTWLCF